MPTHQFTYTELASDTELDSSYFHLLSEAKRITSERGLLVMKFKKTIIAIILLFQISGIYAKNKQIIFFDILGYPNFIGEVVILDYNKDNKILNFRPIEYYDTPKNAKCYYPINQLENRLPNLEPLPPHTLFVGDTVHVVIDQQNNVAFFAKKYKKDYIMFAAYIVSGICSFENENSMKVADTSINSKNTAAIFTYWHPCLLKDSLFNKIVNSYKLNVQFKEKKDHIAEFKDKQLLYIYFEDTLRVFPDYYWSKCLTKNVSLVLGKANSKALKIVLNCNNIEADMFDTNTGFDMEFFKKMHVISIGWKQ